MPRRPSFLCDVSWLFLGPLKLKSQGANICFGGLSLSALSCIDFQDAVDLPLSMKLLQNGTPIL